MGASGKYGDGQPGFGVLPFSVLPNLDLPASRAWAWKDSPLNTSRFAH
jgi:hypothetical protein